MKTIKQRISYAVMSLMAMGFTACTQNEDMAPTLKGQEINATFSVGGMQTRVNSSGLLIIDLLLSSLHAHTLGLPHSQSCVATAGSFLLYTCTAPWCNKP